jgi:hypothetical protein
MEISENRIDKIKLVNKTNELKIIKPYPLLKVNLVNPPTILFDGEA